MDEETDNGLYITLTILQTTLVGLAVSLIFKQRRSSPTRTLPPGPWSVPILGSLPFTGMWDNDVYLELAKLSKKYGDIFHFWVGNT